MRMYVSCYMRIFQKQLLQQFLFPLFFLYILIENRHLTVVMFELFSKFVAIISTLIFEYCYLTKVSTQF